MQPVEVVVQRISRFLSVAEHLTLFIPWVEMMRAESVGTMDRLLEKLAPAAQNRQPVWVEQEGIDTPYKIIPADEVVQGVETLRRQKRLAAGYPGMVMDMTFVYLCAAYDAYFQDYLISFVLACPHCIRSKRQLTYERILDHLETGTLLQHLAQREAHEIGYKSFSEQIEFLRERLGVALPTDTVDVAFIQEVVGIRNLIMHNDGYVNELFLEAAATRGKFSLGERIRISREYWNECKDALTSLVLAMGQDLLCRIYKLEPAEATALIRAGAA